jgi:hypothetical protein
VSDGAGAFTRAPRGPVAARVERPLAPSRLASWTFGVLVLATVAALLLAQRLKHTPTAAQGFALAPSFRPAQGPELLSFRPVKTDEVTVEIVSYKEERVGTKVATLVRNLPWTADVSLCVQWNGRRGSGQVRTVGGAAIRRPLGNCPAAPVIGQPTGQLAPAGEYRVQVRLQRAGAIALSPASFTLVPTPAGAAAAGNGATAAASRAGSTAAASRAGSTARASRAGAAR